MRITYDEPQTSALPFLNDEVWRETILPGGVQLDATAFPDGAVAGTLVGRTFAEGDAGTAFGVAADTDEQVYILARDTPKGETGVTKLDADVVRHGSLIRYNYLPNWATVSSALKTKLADDYELTQGTELGKA